MCSQMPESYGHLEPKQGKLTETSKDCKGLIGAIRGLLCPIGAHWTLLGCPSSCGQADLEHWKKRI